MALSLVSKKTVEVQIGSDSIEVTFRIPLGSEMNTIASQAAQALAAEDANERNAALYEHMISVLPSVISNIKGIELDGEPLQWVGTEEDKSKILDRLSFAVSYIYAAYMDLRVLSANDKKK